MAEVIEADYLVIGAGGMGMAFVDEILTHSDATVVMVDKNFRPGGHWNYVYPFCRLHQTSTCYGVNSTELGGDRRDEFGLNKGCYELASGSEVVAYFDNVMRRRFIPSGRVKFLSMCEYDKDSGRARNTVSGSEYEFKVKKTVDSTYLNVTVPSQRPPTFDVAEGAKAVAVNDLPRIAPYYENFVIVGSGKTGMDAVLFLLSNGIDPDRITWVMPADAWMFDRFTVDPGRKFSDPVTQYAIGILECALEAKSCRDFYDLLDGRELIKQLDRNHKPTRWRCATFTELELEQLRRVKNIIRMGYVEAVSSSEMTLSDGVCPAPANAVYVDCAADGLPKVPDAKVFDGDKITLQTVRMCQQVYSAGFIGNVECNVDADEDRKNELCHPVLLPYLEIDYLRCALQNSKNMAVWLTEPAVVKWINEARTDLFSPLLDFEDPEVAKSIQAMGELIHEAIPKMEILLEEGMRGE
ncbi:NAD(P)/FAD-dependent oxidoreductase [Spongiibacter tropicus]|uniref:NAD(P)/FAD-dependent oxidoreductase n=1 Tax=Spongiibacter tropicus TaxID=454602 RepID=UPI0024E20528|nr:NAD(P)/FAD-dependent oxidoreductase [Spongiibacter tropicus]